MNKIPIPIIIRLSIGLLSILFTAWSGFAQPNPSFPDNTFTIKQFKVKHLSPRQTLAAKDIRAVLLDHRQVLWLATQDGVYCLQDGKFKRFTLSTAYDIAEDGKGRLWLSDARGVQILSKDRSDWLKPGDLGIRIKFKPQATLLERLPNGDIAFFHGASLYHYQTKRQQYFKEAQIPSKMALGCHQMKYVPAEDAYYFSHSLQLLCRVKGQQVQFLTNTLRLLAPTSDTVPYTQFRRRALITEWGGSLTIVGLLDDFYLLNPKQSREDSVVWVKDKLSECSPLWQAIRGYVNSPVGRSAKLVWGKMMPTAVCTDGQGNWFISTMQGLFVAEELHLKPFQKLLIGYSTRGIDEDPQGRLLVGTYDGLYRFSKPLAQTPPQLWLPNFPIWDFLWQRDSLILATEAEPPLIKIPYTDATLSTLTNVTSGEYQNWTKHQFRPSFFEVAAVLSPNTKWNELQFRRGFYGIIFSRKLIRTRNRIWAIRGNHLMALSLRGLAAQTHRLNHPLEKVSEEQYAMIMAKDSSLWLGGTSGLIHVYPELGGQKIKQALRDVPDTLRKVVVKGLYEDSRGHIWIGTQDHGLARLEPKTRRVKWFNRSRGLSENTVYTIQGSHGDSLLWLGTQSGLGCLHVLSGKLINYYKRDGLAGNEFNTGSVYKAQDGRLFFGGVNGITHFKPWMPDFSTNAIKPYVTVELINQSKQKRRKLFLSPEEPTQVYANEKYLEIAFHANNWSKRPLQYRYQLKGADKIWRLIGEGQKLVFYNLKPRTYTLLVSVRSNTGFWSSPIHYDLHIAPSWYQTWWFSVVVVASLVLGLYQLHLLRMRVLRKEFQLRKQISDDLHDDLGSRLYSLRRIASEIVQSPGDKHKYLTNRFEQLSLDVLQSVRDFIWAFDPKYDSFDHFVKRLEDFAENTIGPNVRELVFKNTISNHEKDLGAIGRHHILMIYQELLTNMIKHTNSERIHITIYFRGSHLHISINNEFSGLKINEHGKIGEAHGHESLQRRLDAIKGSLIWEETEQMQHAEIQVLRHYI